MPQNWIPLKLYHYRPQGRRTTGRPKKRWREQLYLWRRNGSKGPILDVYDDDDDERNLLFPAMLWAFLSSGNLIKLNFRKIYIGQPTRVNPFVARPVTRVTCWECRPGEWGGRRAERTQQDRQCTENVILTRLLRANFVALEKQ